MRKAPTARLLHDFSTIRASLSRKGARARVARREGRGNSSAMRSVSLQELGLIPYLEAHRLQEALVEQRARGEIGDTLLFLEHPPVITLGRGAKEEHLRFPRASLNQRGIEVHDTGRGGDVTYHGPGQLVAYPIFDLTSQPDVRRYVRNLEEVMIRTVAHYGLSAARIEEKGLEGVWLRSGDLGDRKIGAVGVRISRWITMHGLALNVTTLLSHFGLIVPCGIENKSVTSIELELSGDPSHVGPRVEVPTVSDVMPKMREAFAEVYEAEIHDGAPDALRVLARRLVAENEGKPLAPAIATPRTE